MLTNDVVNLEQPGPVIFIFASLLNESQLLKERALSFKSGPPSDRLLCPG